MSQPDWATSAKLDLSNPVHAALVGIVQRMRVEGPKDHRAFEASMVDHDPSRVYAAVLVLIGRGCIAERGGEFHVQDLSEWEAIPDMAEEQCEAWRGLLREMDGVP